MTISHEGLISQICPKLWNKLLEETTNIDRPQIIGLCGKTIKLFPNLGIIKKEPGYHALSLLEICEFTEEILLSSPFDQFSEEIAFRLRNKKIRPLLKAYELILTAQKAFPTINFLAQSRFESDEKEAHLILEKTKQCLVTWDDLSLQKILITSIDTGNEIFVNKCLKLGIGITQDLNAFLKYTLSKIPSASGSYKASLINIFRLFIFSGVDVNTIDKNKQTLLHLAVSHRQFDLAKYLVEAGADIDVLDQEKNSPHAIAKKMKLEEIENYLFFSGALDDSGQTLLMSAVSRNDFSIVRAYCSGCFQEENNTLKKILDKKSSNGDTALAIATKKGNIEIVQFLLDMGADPDITDCDKLDLLQIALKGGKSYQPIFCTLLKYVREICKKDERYEDCGIFFDLIEKNEIELLSILLKEWNSRNKKINFDKIDKVIVDGVIIEAYIFALEKKSFIIADLFLKEGLSLNNFDEDGWTPLVYALHKNNFPIVRLLLDKGSNPCATKETMDWMLDFAIRGDNDQLFVHLITSGADIYRILKNESLFDKAVKYKKADYLLLLLKEWRRQFEAIKEKDVLEFTEVSEYLIADAWIQAVSSHDIKMMEPFLQSGIDIDMRDKDGNTALSIAISEGNLKIVNILIDLEANLEIMDDSGQTALMHEFLKKSINFNMISLLLAKGANIGHRDYKGRNILQLCLERKFFSSLIPLLSLKAPYRLDRKAQDFSGNTFLHIAVKAKCPKTLSLLLEFGTECLDIKNKNGLTPLMIAIEDNSLENVKLLLTKKNNIDIRDDLGQTPIMKACIVGSFNILKEILKERPKLDIENHEEKTALILAMERGHLDLAELLTSAGARDHLGRTPLMQSIGTNQKDIIEKLIAESSNIDETDHFGETALMYSAAQDNLDFFSKILAAGALINKTSYQGFTPLQIAINVTPAAINVTNFLIGSLIPVLYQVDPDIENLTDLINHKPNVLIEQMLKIMLSNREEILVLPFLFHDRHMSYHFLKCLKKDEIDRAFEFLIKKYPNCDLTWMKDSVVEVNCDHFRKSYTYEIPPAPTNILIDDSVLINFDQIMKDYDSTQLKNDDGETNLIELRSDLEKFIRNIKEKTVYLAPKHTTEALQDFYTDLEKHVKHIIAKLRDTKVDLDMKRSALIDLALAGPRCADRYKNESYTWCKFLLEHENKPLNLPEQIESILAKYRLGILEKIFRRQLDQNNERIFKGNRSHVINQYLYLIGKQRGIPGYELASLDDVWLPNVTEKTALQTFDMLYTSTEIINRILIESKDLMKREAFENWYKDFGVPKEWREKEYHERFESLNSVVIQKQEEFLKMDKKEIQLLMGDYINNNILKGYRISPVVDPTNLNAIKKSIDICLGKHPYVHLSIKERLEKRKVILNSVRLALNPEKFSHIRIRNFLINDERYNFDIGKKSVGLKEYIRVRLEEERRQAYFGEVVCLPDTNEIKREHIANMLAQLGILQMS